MQCLLPYPVLVGLLSYSEVEDHHVRMLLINWNLSKYKIINMNPKEDYDSWQHFWYTYNQSPCSGKHRTVALHPGSPLLCCKNVFLLRFFSTKMILLQYCFAENPVAVKTRTGIPFSGLLLLMIVALIKSKRYCLVCLPNL